MKYILLSLASLCMFTAASHAQGFAAGLKLGTNINKMEGQSFANKFTYGYSAGAFMEVKLGKKWSIQPEVLFNQVNADTSERFSELYDLNSAKLSNISLRYLSIPLLLNYNISKGLALQAGPQYGILLDQNRNLLENGKDAFKSGDFSLLGGIQVKIASLRIFGRYAIGLSNLNDIDNRDSWKNQSIQLGIGLTIL
jgi:hypothetical protein